MWQALAGYLGSNATASPSEEGETIFIAETNDWRRLKEAFARAVRSGGSGMLTRSAKAVFFLASDERVTSLGLSSSLMAVWPKSDSSRADLAGAKPLLLLSPR